jgi:hypothetical protein
MLFQIFLIEYTKNKEGLPTLFAVVPDGLIDLDDSFFVERIIFLEFPRLSTKQLMERNVALCKKL